MPEHSLPPPPAPQAAALSQRVRLVRNVLPPLIVLVVICVEWLIKVALPQYEFWAHLLFYGLVGPAVTFFTVEWIAEGTRARERAEQEMWALYDRLKKSHERLSALEELMRDLARTPDLIEAVEVAARGVLRATGATHVTVSIPSTSASGGVSASARGDTLLSSPSADLHALELTIVGGGQMTMHWTQPPSEETRELSEALAAEVANGVGAARNRMLDLMSVYSVDQSIRAERNMRGLLARITSNMAERLGVEAWGAYLTDQDGVLRLEYARDSSGEREGGSIAPSFISEVARGGVAAIRGKSFATQVFRDTGSVLAVPMRDEKGLIGVLALGDERENAFTEDRIPLLTLIASQATLAVRNARAYLYSEELAISDERARIAREIHDGVAQSLAFLALRLDVVGKQISKDPSKAESEIKAASGLLREQIKEVRRSIFALRPIDLEKYGLLETLRRYVVDFGEQNGIRSNFIVYGETRLSPADEATLFRILQESLNNVAKHASAKEVYVTLESTAEHSTLSIQDDGRGFDPLQVSGRVSSAGGLGLVQMRERLEIRGGNYRVSSQLGGGTLVEATIPHI